MVFMQLQPDAGRTNFIVGMVIGALVRHTHIISPSRLLLTQAILFGSTLFQPYLGDEEKTVVGGLSLQQDVGMWIGYGLVALLQCF